jgi:hypothetical protein
MDQLTTAAILIAITSLAFGACGIGLLLAVTRAEKKDEK